MIRIKYNGKNKHINAVSELSFLQFNKVFVKGKVSSLQDYLAVMIDVDTEEVLKSKIKSVTVEALHIGIFDTDIEKAIKDKREAFEFNGDHYITDQLDLVTFGKAYYFDLYFQRHKAGQINEYELSMYALAVALTEKLDDELIQNTYDQLAKEKWTKFLPVAFFLLKKSKISRINLIRLYLVFTLKSKMMKWKMSASKRKLIRSAKI